MPFERISLDHVPQCLGDVESELTMIRTIDNSPRLADHSLVEPIAPFSIDAVFDQVPGDTLQGMQLAMIEPDLVGL